MVMMGSAFECAREVVDYLCAKGEKVGLMQIHLFRPLRHGVLPERPAQNGEEDHRHGPLKEPGAIAGAVYLDVCAVLPTAATLRRSTAAATVWPPRT